jgi:hypothetical protein
MVLKESSHLSFPSTSMVPVRVLGGGGGRGRRVGKIMSLMYIR